MSESFSFDAKIAGPWRYVPAVSFAAIMLTGLVVSVSSLMNVSQKTWQEMAPVQRIVQGESTRRFTTQLNEHFLWSKPFAKIQRAVDWNIARDTGAAVSVGCTDWFFLNDELNTFDGGAQNANARAYMVQQVAHLLKQRGVSLMVAVVPDKTRIEQEHLCGVHRPAAFAQRAEMWINSLRKNQVEVIDLREALESVKAERYYRTDSHWNETGADAAALAIARRLQDLQLADKTDLKPAPGAIKTVTEERPGDLFRVSNLEGVPLWLRPPVEKVANSTVAPVVNKSDDLFGDGGLPSIALVGTSFSLRGNFVPFMSQHLGVPVANLAKDGGDFDGAAMTYLQSKAFQQEPPKVVIWEVPERMLQKPFKESERQWLEKLKQGQL
ncbi:cell division protein FtsQ [Undibacterium jejuense]|uniref:Cell division protein FtsQ n=1 Tax=Undibacterium jejuense TaxID=1344949 RepID=A0A923KPK3_9BURK|nr:cell division protein FtsQ [Undibacterium jejuense]MBC3861806.1 cell division protein FtsQ [Undibacterium jejuense]